MAANRTPHSIVFVIFGASGDLAWRKLVPALYNLFLDGWLPDRFEILGLGRSKMSRTRFRDHLRQGVEQFSRRGEPQNGDDWEEFADHLHYKEAELTEAGAYRDLAERLDSRDKKWDRRADRIFYLALPPDMIAPVARHLADAGLNRDVERVRVVVEKPFGRDLASARELNRMLEKFFQERQIFRIDHYLGKETVQNILAFRFGNALFEPLWNRQYMEGDATLFLRADQAEAAWTVIAPVLEFWQSVQPTDFPNYQAGSWGPEKAEILIAQDGRSWITPTALHCSEDLAVCRIAAGADA